MIVLGTQKPPAHFHPYQSEYVQVLQGRMGLEINGCERVLGPEAGQIEIKPWTIHRLFPPPPLPPSEGAEEDNGAANDTTRFLLSGSETSEAFRLDIAFFQNWYGYQDEVVKSGARMDLIQVLCMFDAGGSYMAAPWWIPFGRSLSQAFGIVVGRWLGAMLGYQPFYRKWTTDWDAACEKMATSYLQKRFAWRIKFA
ncbi:MAG: hypothetical protein Q9223_000371 [Gallowayella weberi]